MRKAAEAGNDIAMIARECKSIVVACRFIKRHATFLIREVFGMHERQIEEGAQVGGHLFVVSGRKRALRNGERKTIEGKGASCAAVDLSRELVERDGQCEGTVSARFPRVALREEMLLTRQRFQQRLVTFAHGRVESVIACKPQLRAGIPPEGENIFRGTHGGAACHVVSSSVHGNDNIVFASPIYGG